METNSLQGRANIQKSARVLGMSLTQIIILSVMACCVLTIFGVLAGTIFYDASLLSSHSKAPIFYLTSTPAPSVRLYDEDALKYLERVTEFPEGFQIDFSQDKFGNISNDTNSAPIGTFATRYFFNPVSPRNEISTVLYFIEVYNTVEEAKASYDIQLLEKFRRPSIYSYHIKLDEGAVESRLDGRDSSKLYTDELARKSNVVIFITCSAILDEDANLQDVALWSFYYQDLLLSGFQ